MKTLIVIMFWSLLIPLKAETGNKFDVFIKDENKIYVELSDFSDNYSIHISDANGKNIYEANDLNIVNLKFTIDLANQKEGIYQLIVKDEVKMKSVPLMLNNNALTLNKYQSKTTFFPQFEKDGNSILVKLISNEENDMHLDIIDDDGKRLYHEQIGGQIGMIGKRFKFEPGDYTLTLNSNGYHFKKVLNID